MGLKDVLVKLKLVELEQSPGATGTGSADSPELAELLARVPPAPPVDERKLARPVASASSHRANAAAAAQPAAGAPKSSELPGFDEVYRAAGVVDPSHGFTAFKVLEFLGSPELASLEGKARAATLATFLRMNPAGAVSIADVLEDAVRRDQALDQFEKFLQAKLTERSSAAEREIARLESELAETQKRLREAIGRERDAVDAARAEFDTWRDAKRVEEMRLFDAVSPFVEENPITRES